MRMRYAALSPAAKKTPSAFSSSRINNKATLLSLGLMGLAIPAIGQDRNRLPRLGFLRSGLGMTDGPVSEARGDGRDSTVRECVRQPAGVSVVSEGGTWPDKAILVLEIWASASKLSMSKNGSVQQDIERFPRKWAFFNVSEDLATAHR